MKQFLHISMLITSLWAYWS